MKKFLAIAVIAVSFVACNDEKKADATTPNADSAVTTTTTTTATPVVDSATKTVVDSAKATTVTVDTAAKKH